MEEQKGLTTRQHRLKNFLKDNFISGKFFSIREICENVKYSSGEHCYKYDDSITTHDHCVELGNDVRAINACLVDGWKLIIKDKKGGVKLAENEQEFKTWWNAEAKKVDDKKIKLNMMLSKAQEDGIMPIINKANNPVDTTKDLTPIDAYMERTFEMMFVNLADKVIKIARVKKYKFDDISNKAMLFMPNDNIITLENINEALTISHIDRPFYENYTKEYIK